MEAFEKSALRQELDFLDAEKHWEDAQNVRDQEFETFVNNIHETFAVNARDREQAFREAENKLEDTFREKERERDDRFQRGETSRGEAFRQEHEIREKRSQWYASVRDLRFQRGRQSREASCEQLEKQLTDQFDTLFQFLGDAFAVAEQRRDGVVEEMVSP